MAVICADNGLETSTSAPRCIASTGDRYRGTVVDTVLRETGEVVDEKAFYRSSSNGFKSAHLAPDGSTVITYNDDRRTRSFLFPHDVFEATETITDLAPYSISRPKTSFASTFYPHYDVNNPSTTLILQSQADLPIRLINTSDLSYTHASYPWQHSKTEAWVTPNSLTFAKDGRRFIAGAKEKLAIFDIEQDGQEPVRQFQTRQPKKVRKQYGDAGFELSGFVTALSVSANGVLAAGTTEGQIALYDAEGAGEEISVFSVKDDGLKAIEGEGIMQLAWSPHGQYLFAAERMSDTIQILDIRMGKRLGYLLGRKARVPHRMSFDLVNNEGACDMWAGGTDGMVRAWKDVGSREGGIAADISFTAHERGVVTSVAMDSLRGRLVTSSSEKIDTMEFDEQEDDFAVNSLDNTLKIWSV